MYNDPLPFSWITFDEGYGDNPLFLKRLDGLGLRYLVVVCRDQLPGPEQWVILRRTLGEKPVLKYYLSNAPEDIPLSEMVWVSGMRWPIETTFEEGKGELGMDQYETRSWRGWHHHMTLTMLAHHFLVRLRLRLQDKAPALTVPQVRLLLRAVLPKKTFEVSTVLDLVHRIQHRNHAAYLSHRKRKHQQIDGL